MPQHLIRYGRFGHKDAITLAMVNQIAAAEDKLQWTILPLKWTSRAVAATPEQNMSGLSGPTSEWPHTDYFPRSGTVTNLQEAADALWDALYNPDLPFYFPPVESNGVPPQFSIAFSAAGHWTQTRVHDYGQVYILAKESYAYGKVLTTAGMRHLPCVIDAFVYSSISESDPNDSAPIRTDFPDPAVEYAPGPPPILHFKTGVSVQESRFDANGTIAQHRKWAKYATFSPSGSEAIGTPIIGPAMGGVGGFEMPEVPPLVCPVNPVPDEQSNGYNSGMSGFTGYFVKDQLAIAKWDMSGDY